MCSWISPRRSRPMREPTSCATGAAARRCTTCADEGLEGRVLALLDEGFARVQLIDGGSQDVALDLVGEIDVGDCVLVHAGVALVKLDR